MGKAIHTESKSRSHDSSLKRQSAPQHQLTPTLIQRTPSGRSQIDPNSLTPADVQTLQRSMGNAAVARLIANRAAPTVQRPAHLPTVQAKLKVGSNNDPFEQEANSVASQVVSQLHGAEQISPSLSAPPTFSNLQRSTEPSEVPPQVAGNETEPGASAAGGEVTPDMANRIQAARGGGQQLDAPVRSAMEQAFGADFGGVRIHQSQQSDTLNRSINARAFTTGQDVFFRQGEYRPGSTAGQGLLAHELTHVVQQSGGALQRRYQAEADEPSPQDRLPSAQQVARSGQKLGQRPVVAQRAPSGRIHRCGDDEPKTTEKKPPVSVKPTTGTRPTSGKSPTTKSPSVTKPIDTASDLRSTAPTSSTPPPVPEEPRTKGRDLTKVNGDINKSSLSPEHKARALALVENPNRASQAGYGICGLTSMLRSILISDPERFVTLAVQATSDTELVKKWQPFFQLKATDEQKKKKELDFLVAQWLVRKSTTGKVSQKQLKHNTSGGVDEIVKTKESTEVFQDQKDFSDTFPMTGWESGGHFASTAGGLNYTYSSASGKEGFKIKITDFAKDWALAKSKVGPLGSINASIKGHDFYKNITTGKKLNGQKVEKGPEEVHPSKYRHWVVFDDVTEESHKDSFDVTKKFFRIKVWTYEDYWDALVSEDVIGQYIHSLVVM